jgi:HAE1 family hydrophobic/amphiphilic exporter-1
MSVAVAISLLEALTLTPMRCSQFLEVQERRTALGRNVDNAFKALARGYHGGLRWSLSRRWTVVVISTVIFLSSLLFIKVLRKEFTPAQDQSMFFVRAQAPVGSSIDFTNEKFKEIEAFIQSRPEVERYFSAIGGFGGGEVNSGQVFVVLKEPHDRPVTAPYTKRPGHEEIMDHFRKELNKIKDVKARIQDPSLSGLSAQRGYPIEVTVLGPDREQLIGYATQIEKKMGESPLLADVDTNYEEGVPEIQVYPDRQRARERGVNVEAIAGTINAMIAGERVGKYTQHGRRYDVRVRLLPSQRAQAEDIQKLWVWNNHGELVQLKDVVVIKENPTALTITRRNRERSVNLHANVAPKQSQADAIAETQRIIREILPEGYYASFGGNTQTFQESFKSLWFVLWLGVLVAYMILASQFNAYKDPFIILLALPFSVSGAFLALWLTGQSLNIYSFIGLVLLMGIVKKNSILLVEFTNQLRAQGKGVHEALLEACPIRLRPILMTSMATIAAALPPALALGAGAEALRPMAVTVIGGMIVSTFFTLFVIPAVYSLMARSKPNKPRE